MPDEETERPEDVVIDLVIDDVVTTAGAPWIAEGEE
jgi:hypothetical protein